MRVLYTNKLLYPMVKNRGFLLLLIFVSAQQMVLSQTNRYMVFFADKASSPYSVDSPLEYLSQKAIDRKNRSPISFEDLPVNPSYIAGLEAEGISVLFTSKWMNGALVEATLAQLESLNLPYVSNYEYIAPDIKPIASGRIEGGGYIDVTNGRTELTYTQNAVLDIPKMHIDGYTGSGIRVAVFDGGFSGIDNNAYLKHAFDENRIFMTFDMVRKSTYVYDYSTHGANVFSIFGSYIDGSYTGGGYGANFDLFVTEDVGSEYRIEEYNWLIAAEKADSAGVDIITTSLGYYDFDDSSMNYTIDNLDGNTAIITQAVELAFSKGMLIVTSAGNEGRDSNLWKRITFPADANNILAVGAVQNSDFLKTDFSSPGPTADGRIKPDVMAVGGETTYINNASVISTGNGTSYSAPLITGLAAGLWQKYPELTNVELKNLIIQSGDNYDNPNNNYGHGIPSYIRASYIREGIEVGIDTDSRDKLIIYPNPVNGKYVNVKLKEMLLIASIEIINIHGQKIIKQAIENTDHLKIDVSNIQEGLYLVRINDGNSIDQTSLVVE